MIKRFLYIQLMFPVLVFAQDIEVIDRYDEMMQNTPAQFLIVRGDIWAQDGYVGLAVGQTNSNRNFSAFINFDARPFRKKVWEYQGNNLYYQYKEERYFVGIGGEILKPIAQGPLEVFGQIDLNYTWGIYGGTDRKPENGFVIVPRVGLTYPLRDYLILRVGYSHLDAKLQEVSKHKIYLAILLQRR